MNRVHISPRHINLTEIYRNLSTGEKRFFLIICLLALLMTIGWILFSPNGVKNYYVIQKKLHYAQVENRKLEAENQQLRVEIDKLKADPEYLEMVARKEFGLVKKNEAVFNFD